MAKKGLNIYQRKDGRWEGRLRSGYTEDGKAKYISIYGKSYSAVKDEIERKRAEVINGCACNCTYTVGQIADFGYLM